MNAMNTQHNQSSKLRIGAVTYLNTKPLVHGLAALLPTAELIYDYPSRLADALATGELDIALVPSAEVLQHSEWTIVSDACIGCRGPVLSVKLLFRVPPSEVRTLSLDEGSRTSAVLAQILLQGDSRHHAAAHLPTLGLRTRGSRRRCRAGDRRPRHPCSRCGVHRSLGPRRPLVPLDRAALCVRHVGRPARCRHGGSGDRPGGRTR